MARDVWGVRDDNPGDLIETVRKLIESEHSRELAQRYSDVAHDFVTVAYPFVAEAPPGEERNGRYDSMMDALSEMLNYVGGLAGSGGEVGVGEDFAFSYLDELQSGLARYKGEELLVIHDKVAESYRELLPQ